MKILMIGLLLIFSGPLGYAANQEAQPAGSSKVSTVGHGQDQTCLEIDRRFRDHILNLVKEAGAQFDKANKCMSQASELGHPSPSCDTQNSELFSSVKTYRDSTRKLRASLVRAWASEQNPDLIRVCLGDLNKDALLQDNSRVLQVRGELVNCRPLSTSWAQNLTQAEAKALSSSAPPEGMTFEEVAFIKEFRFSPLGRSMNEQLLSTAGTTIEQDRREISQRLNELKFYSDKLVGHLSKLKDHELHQIYVFKNQFGLFAESLGSGKEMAIRCMESSAWYKDCSGLGSWLACKSRAAQFLIDMAPVINVVDAIKESQLNWGALVSGAASSEEYVEAQSKSTAQGILGVISLLPSPAAFGGPASAIKGTVQTARKNLLSRVPVETRLPQTFDKIRQKIPAVGSRFESLGKNIPQGRQIVDPKEIPFEESDFFRATTSSEMLKRAETLSPEIKKTIIGIYNRLGNKRDLTPYFQKLYSETVEHMSKRAKPKDLELLRTGRVSVDAMASVLVKRFKSIGDETFTTITKETIKHGRRPLRRQGLDLESRNKRFRAAIAEGPFFDMAFDPWNRGGHGAFTHMIQRDIVRDVVESEMKGNPQEFWDFLGSTKGINWWVDLFDAGGSVKSFHRPENLTQFIVHELGDGKLSPR